MRLPVVDVAHAAAYAAAATAASRSGARISTTIGGEDYLRFDDLLAAFSIEGQHHIATLSLA
jgi:hypothetical protein